MYFRKHRHKNKLKVWDGELDSIFPDDDDVPVRIKRSKGGKKKKKWRNLYSLFDAEITEAQKNEIITELMMRRTAIVKH